MLKSSTAVLVAASIAAVITVLTAPSGSVTAGPRPVLESAEMHECAARPWPYLRCVGTQYGNPRVRLVTTEKLQP